MSMLSEDDLNLGDMTDAELDLAWDLWFEIAQTTNDWDPPYEHGVLVDLERPYSSASATTGSTRDARRAGM